MKYNKGVVYVTEIIRRNHWTYDISTNKYTIGLCYVSHRMSE